MDSKQAASVLIDPLNAPEPSQETGPGTHFARPVEPPTPFSTTSSTKFFRRSSNEVNGHAPNQSSAGSNRGPSSSSSSRQEKFPNYREQALGQMNEGPAPRKTNDPPPAYEAVSGSSSRERGSSLKERYPGDDSHKPLKVIRRDSQKANRSPHLNKRHMPGADSIDRLDPTINKIPYHHEGPFDVALRARNTEKDTSPLAALESTNQEALKATPQEKIYDSLRKHEPLDGVAAVPSGMPDSFGRELHYEEGENQLMDPRAEGGQFKHYAGVDYHPDDVRGQGEPSYSLDRALQAHTIHEREFDGQRGIELSDRPLMGDYHNGEGRKSLDTRDPIAIAGNDAKYADLQHAADVDAHPKPAGKGIKEGLKRRIGSLKKGPDEWLS